MEIRHAHIFGFGKWVDVDFDFSDGPYTCIYGENESGKSTIQQFMMFMLFGFPPKKRASFRPKTSGKMGGRLTLFDQDAGEYTVERLDGLRNGAAVCHMPDGQTRDEEWLQGRLQGMTFASYQSVFTFSALDLMGLRDMKEEDLGEVLLGIGLTASANIQSIEKNLDNKIGELFKPSGKIPAINQQLLSLDKLYGSLKEYTDTEETYREKQAAIYQLTADIENLQESVQQEKLVLNRLERQQQALSVVQEYRQEKALLSNYPESISFPEKGEERLKELNSQLLPLKSELSVLQNNEKKYNEHITSIRADFYEEQIYQEAAEKMKKKSDFLEKNQTLKSLSESISKLKIQLDAELEQLQIGIDRSDLYGLTLPFHLEKAWSRMKDDQKELNAEREKMDTANKQMTTNRDYLQKQEAVLTNDLLPDYKRNELEDRINQHNERQFMEKMKQDVDQQQNGFEKMRATQKKQSRLFLSGSIAAAIILFIIAISGGESMLYLVSAILALAGVLQWGIGKKSGAEMGSIMQDDTSIPSKVSDREKDEARQLISLQDQKKSELAAVQDRLRSLDIELLQWEEKLRGIEQRESRLQKQVTLQYVDYPFLKQVDIHYWPDLFNKLKTILNIHRDLNFSEQRFNELTEERHMLDEQLNGFYRMLNWEPENKPIETKYKAIEALLEQNKNQVRLLEQYRKWVKENHEQQEKLIQKMQVYQSRKQELFAIANAGDEEGFLKTANQLETKQMHETKTQQQLGQLHAFLHPDELEPLLNDGMLHHNELKKRYDQVSEQITTMEEAINRKRQQYADIYAELSGMESSESQSDLQHRFAIESEHLKKLSHEWSVYKVAKEMLTETKRKYREKYLGNVIEKTASYFTEITNNHYQALYPPTSTKPFRVEANDGIRYTAGELSKGTIDQLYVSLRLAIGEVMSEKHKLPFIIDDAFVHFDAVRIKQLAGILAEISTARQIIFFTCKRDVLETAEGIHVIDLNNSVRIS